MPSVPAICYGALEKGVVTGIYYAKEIRDDLDALQQVGLVALSFIKELEFQGIIKDMPSLGADLNEIQILDFFAILKLPKYLFDREFFDKEKFVIDRLEEAFQAIGTVFCAATYFQEWSLIDLSRWAAHVGKLPLCKFIVNECADDWNKRFLCLAFACTVIQGLFLLRQSFSLERHNLDLKQIDAEKSKLRKAAFWTIAFGVAEIAFNSAILGGCGGQVLFRYMLVAKSTGLLRKFMSPKL